MMNGWYLYQTIASRIFARAGFYQVGGAYGFRDQLQDAMNICTINPTATKEQILICAEHQFKEGDVLHWWHPEKSNKTNITKKAIIFLNICSFTNIILYNHYYFLIISKQYAFVYIGNHCAKNRKHIYTFDFF